MTTAQVGGARGEWGAGEKIDGPSYRDAGQLRVGSGAMASPARLGLAVEAAGGAQGWGIGPLFRGCGGEGCCPLTVVCDGRASSSWAGWAGGASPAWRRRSTRRRGGAGGLLFLAAVLRWEDGVLLFGEVFFVVARRRRRPTQDFIPSSPPQQGGMVGRFLMMMQEGSGGFASRGAMMPLLSSWRVGWAAMGRAAPGAGGLHDEEGSGEVSGRALFGNEGDRTWTPQRPVPGIGTDVSPALCVCGPWLVMAWRGIGDDDGIWCSRSTDGFSWSPSGPCPARVRPTARPSLGTARLFGSPSAACRTTTLCIGRQAATSVTTGDRSPSSQAPDRCAHRR